MGVETTVALNSRLLTALVQSVERDGAIAFVVLLNESRNALLEDTLARAGVPRLDVGECLRGVHADRRKVPSGNHYTGLANEALARCTAPAVERALLGAVEHPQFLARSIPAR